MKKAAKFTKKGENMLSSRPSSMEEFLNSNAISRKIVDTNSQKNVKTKISKNEKLDIEESNTSLRRFELKMPDDLAKKVLDHAFQNRKSKAAVIIEALNLYFNR